MSENNGAKPHREPKTIVQKPEWTVSLSEAAKVREHYRARERRRHAEQAEQELLIKSWRMDFAGKRARRKFAEAFMLTMETGGDKKDFKTNCIGEGISPTLIFLLLGMVWDVLYYWWTHRND